MQRFLLVLALCAVAAAPVTAAAPPFVGQPAPDFELKTIDGKAARLSEVTPTGPVVLVVLRGFPGYQCPMCNRQAQEFIQKAPAFAERGARVVMVYPGPPQDLTAKAAEFMANKTLPGNFELWLDPGYTFTNQYGLRWDAPKETAYPATYVIDRQGAIIFLKAVKSHGGRTVAAEILDVLPKPKAK